MFNWIPSWSAVMATDPTWWTVIFLFGFLVILALIAWALDKWYF